MQMNGSVLKNGLKVFTTFKYLSIDVQLLASYFEKIKLLEMIFFFTIIIINFGFGAKQQQSLVHLSQSNV